MTEKQKAKAYDEAFGRAKALYAKGAPDSLHLEEMFPELKENKDDRLRNNIIELVKQSSSILNPMNQKSMIAWLKKQGTKESKKTSIWNHWKDGIAGNGEGKLIYLIKNGNDYRLSSSLGFECDYIKLSDLDELMLSEKQGEQKPTDKKYTFNAIPRLLSMIQPTDRAKAYCQKLIDILIQEGYSADAKIVGNCLKQMNGEKVAMATMDEQKPAEWNEEDEKNYNTILKIIRDSDTPAQLANKLAFWIESLKPQPKQEWSEEDERMINSIIENLDEGEWLDIYQVDWLKSLKAQPHWKPSEEQMKALNEIINTLAVSKHPHENDYLFNMLNGLRKNLKKL